MSIPIHFLFKRWATAMVVPQPQKESNITSPSFDDALMMRSKSASGFWVS